MTRWIPALHRLQKGGKHLLWHLVIDADAAFHRHLRARDFRRLAHRGQTVADQRRIPHQHGPEAARLDAVGGAADVQVDLTVAMIGADPRGCGQLLRL